MKRESIMICIDNSCYSINEDYHNLSRLHHQQDAIRRLITNKLNVNPENMCGLLAMNDSCETLCSPTRDNDLLNKSLGNVNKRSNFGTISLAKALRTCALCLVHRLYKHSKGRIIVFVCSPLNASKKNVRYLYETAALLRKINMSVDLINIGIENQKNDNLAILTKFNEICNNEEYPSHLVNIKPVQMHDDLISDQVLKSAICTWNSSSTVTSTTSSNINESMDDQLALALRMSIEEQKQREMKQQSSISQESLTTTSITEAKAVPSEAQQPPSQPQQQQKEEEEEEEEGSSSDEDDEDDELLAQAIALSMMQNKSSSETKTTETKTTEEPTIGDALDDPDFVNSLLDDIPGVSNNDINDIWNEINNPKDQDDKHE